MTNKYQWVGSEKSFVDEATVLEVQPVVVGHFGGCSSSGQTKNEDGCLVFVNDAEDWEFTILLDAHNSAESARLVVDRFSMEEEEIRGFLAKPLAEAFILLEKHILSILQNESFREACRAVVGETAALFVVRKGKYVWWLSVGDCLLFVLHPELKAMGEVQMNQRSFYEWVGQVNTFDLPVPSYSRGIKELRQGRNLLFMTTDGLVECPNAPFGTPDEIFKVFEGCSNVGGVMSLLKCIERNNVRDSTTILSWEVFCLEPATMPSNA